MNDPTFVYLAQGAWIRLSQLRFPERARVFALCYDDPRPLPRAEQTIFDTRCTWAAGRNRLQSLALEQAPDADYFVFCDDDIVFVKGSFEQFEAMVAQTRPLIGVPLMPKAIATRTLDEQLTVQRGLALDEQMVALHRSVLGEQGLAPLETAYDDVSWYVACLIFEYLALKFHASSCDQYNTIEIANPKHTIHDGQTLYKAGRLADYFPVFLKYITDRFGAYDKAPLAPCEYSYPAGT